MKISTVILGSVLLLSSCKSIKQDKGGNLFVPKEVTLTKIKNGDVNICKEVILDKDGKQINKYDLVTQKINYSQVFFHEFNCINALPPNEKFFIPAKVWYEEFNNLYFPTNYKQVRLKIAEINSICGIKNTLRVECENVKNTLETLDEFLYKEDR